MKRTRVRVCAMLVALLLAGCDDECSQNATRCDDDRAEMCSADGVWELIADCAAIEGAEFTCCADPAGGFNCMLDEECLPPAAVVDGGSL